jgi:cell division septation protein DedD
MMNRLVGFAVVAASAVLLLPGAVSAQVKRFPPESIDALVLHNVTAEPATL